MIIFYRAFDSSVDFLHRKVKRDSWLWNSLSKIQQGLFFLRAAIHKHSWKSSSDQFEGFVEKYSRETPNFFVLQIGACDGVRDDPIHRWIKKYRWRGILVEPQKNEFERLKINYQGHENLKFENAAIAESSGPRALYKIKDEKMVAEWQQGLASLLPNPGLQIKEMLSTETVQCITFDTLLDRYQVKQIDLLQIDVEGYDYELIKSFDFTRIMPKLIRYERIHLKLSDQKSLLRKLSQLGYKTLEMEVDTGAILQPKSL